MLAAAVPRATPEPPVQATSRQAPLAEPASALVREFAIITDNQPAFMSPRASP
jgi:hypothetical protein